MALGEPLTEEWIYRLAPSGGMVQAASELVRLERRRHLAGPETLNLANTGFGIQAAKRLRRIFGERVILD